MLMVRYQSIFLGSLASSRKIPPHRPSPSQSGDHLDDDGDDDHHYDDHDHDYDDNDVDDDNDGDGDDEFAKALRRVPMPRQGKESN